MRKHKHATLDAAFWAHVTPDVNDKCWPWRGSHNANGYGQLTFNKKHYFTHRLAHELFIGPITKRNVCHRCDNRICVNPSHLFQASQSENMMDCVRKGRISELMLRNIEIGKANAAAKEEERKRKARKLNTQFEQAGLGFVDLATGELIEPAEALVRLRDVFPRQRDAMGQFM